MSFDQGEFTFDAGSGDAGYRRWRVELDEAKRAFELRWGVILGRPVRLRFEGHKRSIEGVIQLISPPRAAKPQDIRLRLKTLEFTPADIESLTALDP
jgi:hypothetical protein